MLVLEQYPYKTTLYVPRRASIGNYNTQVDNSYRISQDLKAHQIFFSRRVLSH